MTTDSSAPIETRPLDGESIGFARMVPALMAVAAVHTIWVFFGENLVAYGNLFDGDSYARLIRVRHLIETGSWFDTSIPRINAPYGGALHWTRPLDVLILLPAFAMTPVFGFETALYWAGALCGPVLHGVLALAVAWAASPVIGPARAGLAGVLVAIQFQVLGYATLGNADHHVLFALLVVMAIGSSVRSLRNGAAQPIRFAVLTGVFVGSAIWVGPEGLIALAAVSLVLGVFWILGEPGATRLNLAMAASFVIMLVFATLVERGPASLHVGYERVSIVHVTMAALLLGFWAAVWLARTRDRLTPQDHTARSVSGIAGAGAAVTVVLSLFPAAVRGPLADLHPDVLYILDEILEFQRIPDFAHFLTYLGGGTIALAWAIWRVKDAWPTDRRYPWLMIAVALGIYGVIAFNWVRGSIYVGAFSCIALADAAASLNAACDRAYSGLKRSLIKVPAMTLLLGGTLGLGAAGIFVSLPAPTGTAEGMPAPVLDPDDPRPCPVKSLSRHLNGPPWKDRPRLILASANFGPELVYRTRHAVTASMHHPNAAGILDNVRILGATSEEKALDIIEKRGIDLIVLCRFGRKGGYIQGRGDPDIFYRRLIEDRAPGWLKPVRLPDDLDRSFRVFQVEALGHSQVKP